MCKQYFWSYNFKQHWMRRHRARGNVPSAIETKLAVSQDEKDYFRRGQQRKKRRRAATGHGTGSQKSKNSKAGKGKGKQKAASRAGASAR